MMDGMVTMMDKALWALPDGDLVEPALREGIVNLFKFPYQQEARGRLSGEFKKSTFGSLPHRGAILFILTQSEKCYPKFSVIVCLASLFWNTYKLTLKITYIQCLTLRLVPISLFF